MNVLIEGSKILHAEDEGFDIYCPQCATPDNRKITVDYETAQCSGCAATIGRFEDVGRVEWRPATNIARMRAAIEAAKKPAKKQAKRKCRCRGPSSLCKCGKKR